MSQNGNPKWTPDSRSTWNGCVTNRGGTNGPSGSNYDTNVAMPSIGNSATLFPAEQYGSCSQKITLLNYDWANMKKLVDDLYPAGNTNQGIGIAHGWMSLTGGGPYPARPTEDPNFRYTKAIILSPTA